MRRRWLRRILILLVVAAAIVVLRLTVFRSEPVPVTVYRTGAGRVEETVTNSKAGTVKSRRRASLSPEIGGRVAELPARKGARVVAGDVLLRIANDDYAAEVEVQQRAVEAAEGKQLESCLAAEQAVRDLERNERLAVEQIVSAEVLEYYRNRRDVTRSACDAAGALHRQAMSAVRLARINLEKSIMRAPFDGVVAELSTELGEWITPSPPGVPIPSVIELIDTSAIYVSAPMDEVDIGKVDVELPVRVTLDAFPGTPFPGRTTRVAPYVQDFQEQNRTFEVEVELDDPAVAANLVPGSSADVEVILDGKDDVLRIPSYALIEGGKVLVVRDGVLEPREVTTGLRNWEFTEIIDGLDASELVVVSLDRAEVREGARVVVEGETLK